MQSLSHPHHIITPNSVPLYQNSHIFLTALQVIQSTCNEAQRDVMQYTNGY